MTYVTSFIQHSMTQITSNQIHGYVVSYTAEIYDNVHAPFKPLDNRENLRPDWQEYWPIRNYLLNQNLIENHYYGFFSPRFKEKTGLDSRQISEYLISKDAEIDLFIFSPQPDMGSFFLNIFEQNELFDPGFIDSIQKFIYFVGLDIDISDIVMDSRNIIFSNYFMAKPSFWRRWISICENLFYVCEFQKNIARQNGWLDKTNYRDGLQRKVFIIERIASLILAIDKKYWKIHSHNPFIFAYSATRLNEFPDKAILCDALKIAYNETGNLFYINQYSNIINSIKNKL